MARSHDGLTVSARSRVVDVDAHLAVSSGGIKSVLKQLTGATGFGTYRINVTLEWTPIRPAIFDEAKVALGGDLEVSFANRARQPVAQLQPFYAIAFPSSQMGPVQARLDLGANVSPAQLESIERERGGGPIMLHLMLQGLIFRPSSLEESELIPRVEGFWGELAYNLKPAQWVEVLENFGYAQGFLLQVPKYGSRSSPKAAEATVDLEKAIGHMAEGRYRDAVAACRDALEVAYGDGDRNRYPELGYKVENLRNADKDARFWLARQALWALTHAAKHKDEVTQTITWERSDAVAIITMISSLLEQAPPN